MQQLRVNDAVKKRGRKKKAAAGGKDSSSKSLQDANNVDSDKESGKTDASHSRIKPEDIKKEIPSEPTTKEDKNSSFRDVKVKMEPGLKNDDEENKMRSSGDDSDEVPLIKRTKQEMKKEEGSDYEEEEEEDEIICRSRRIRRGRIKPLESTSGSESSTSDEDSDASTSEFGRGSTVADRLRARKRSGTTRQSVSDSGMKLRSRDSTPHHNKQKATEKEKESKLSSPPKSGTSSQKTKLKFGDGSDFRPGWEEEVYVYKKSLRMPTRLITVSKPSRFHRLSASLPDLDPGSPALSVSMDSSDVCLGRGNKRTHMMDSDMESNYSFSIAGLGSKIDDEEATSSTTVSCPPKAIMMKHSSRGSENNSIVDVLAQKVGSSNQKDSRKRQQQQQSSKSGSGKIVNKSGNEPELLPTPSSETKSSRKDRISSLKNNNRNNSGKNDAVLLGYFRRKTTTLNNFRDAFKKNNHHMRSNEISAMLLKRSSSSSSRTRTETKILKKEATIREVFGEDRPASAPPIQNHDHDDSSQDDDDDDSTMRNNVTQSQESSRGSGGTLCSGKRRTLKQKVVSRLRKNASQLLRGKVNSKRRLLSSSERRRKDLLKSLATKKLHRIRNEMEERREEEEEEAANDREEEINEEEDDRNDPEIRNKRKLKLRPGRRKFRSGFDYIRKKKRPLRKDEVLPKDRKRVRVIYLLCIILFTLFSRFLLLTRIIFTLQQNQASKPSPESVTDIQTEIRTWVIKKGVGETILHRAARLGYMVIRHNDCDRVLTFAISNSHVIYCIAGRDGLLPGEAEERAESQGQRGLHAASRGLRQGSSRDSQAPVGLRGKRQRERQWRYQVNNK